MSSSDKDKKVIHLNPEWFNGSTIKTRKRRLNAPVSANDTTAPISQGLKQKILMRRIKENRLQQIENLTQPHAPSQPFPASTRQNDKEHNVPQFKTDDFADSMDFLHNMSSVKTLDREKEIYEKNKQKRRDDLYNRTIHNPYRLKNHNIITPNNDFLIDVNIPNELTTANHFSSLDTVIPTYNVDKTVPYGVLRNGIKPTYRDWKRTSSSTTTTMPTTTPSSQYPITPRLLAQKKIQMLRNKIAAAKRTPDIMTLDEGNGSTLSFDSNPPTTFETVYPDNTASNSAPTNCVIPNGVPFKKLIKKTFKQKYTLGRSKVKKSVAVLIKNSTIRHHVIDAHKKLKAQPLADVKRYLREHNLIKVGTDAPNDVLRQLYENSILSGDVVNINGGTLLHNFTNSKIGEHVADGLEPITLELEDIFKDDTTKPE